MTSKIHALAGLVSFTCIVGFWSSTLIAELLLSPEAVAAVKAGIVDAFVLFIPCMILTGATGFAMSGQGRHPQLVAKRQRMPLIALNGLLIMIPSALLLDSKASAGELDSLFDGVQVLELLAGAVNLFFMGSNIRDGMRLTDRLRARSLSTPDGAMAILACVMSATGVMRGLVAEPPAADCSAVNHFLVACEARFI